MLVSGILDKTEDAVPNGRRLPHQYKMRDPRQFREALLAWYARHKRDLPWRNTRDPYAIWLSEIMLQQTRVTAALPYYERFLQRFPHIDALANADEADLLAHWAGLGYYSRARNMQRAAKAIQALGGYPNTYDALRGLPGIGDYTAAAVASIAFQLPHAVVDGNVFRVLSRVYEDSTDIALPEARKHFFALANKLLDPARPGEFNQALMELGATVCLPKNPQCLLCPVQSLCKASRSGRQYAFPVKEKVQKQVSEERTVFWIERDRNILAWQRGPNERLMAGFWELPERKHLPHAVPGRTLGSFRHGITFHSYTFRVVEAEVPRDHVGCEWIGIDHLSHVPVSTILRKAAAAIRK
jgi:A/G-specific adenine glycosylase